jgi:hypothetical protein
VTKARGAPRRSCAALRELALQALAAALALGVWFLWNNFSSAVWPFDFFLCCLIGIAARLLARIFRSPPWWQVIHLFFAPALFLALFWQSRLGFSPFWSLAAFLLLWLLFRGAPSGQAPLYLSGESAARSASTLLPQGAALLDVGAGIGSFLLPLSRMRPDMTLTGIENAPALWVLGKIRLALSGKAGRNVRWQMGNFWQIPWAKYDAIYCFLSPAPMPAVWEKARMEMRPGSLVISKAFPIPGIAAVTRFKASSATDTLYMYTVQKTCI